MSRVCSNCTKLKILYHQNCDFSIFYQKFKTRDANNIITGTKYEQYERIRQDIRDFKLKSGVEKVVVLWTESIEDFSTIKNISNETGTKLKASLIANSSEITPSTIFAIASIAESCLYINGSPQNIFEPGIFEMAEMYGATIAGDNSTFDEIKLEKVLIDFLIHAGIRRKVVCFVSDIAARAKERREKDTFWKSSLFLDLSILGELCSRIRVTQFYFHVEKFVFSY